MSNYIGKKYPLDEAAQQALMKNTDILPDVKELNRVVLGASVRLRRYRNEDIFKEKADGDSLHIILDGVVLIHMNRNGNGSEGNDSTQPSLLITFLKRGELLGEMACVDESPRSATAEAIRPTTTLSLDVHTFKIIRSEFPALALELLLGPLAQRVRAGNVHAELLLNRTPSGRLARFLFDMVQHHGSKHAQGILVDLYVTQKRLASMLDIPESSVSRLMTAMEGNQLIRRPDNRHVIVRDLKALRDLAYS